MADNRIAIRHQNDLKPIRFHRLVFEFFSMNKCSKEREPKLPLILWKICFAIFFIAFSPLFQIFGRRSSFLQMDEIHREHIHAQIIVSHLTLFDYLIGQIISMCGGHRRRTHCQDDQKLFHSSPPVDLHVLVQMTSTDPFLALWTFSNRATRLLVGLRQYLNPDIADLGDWDSIIWQPIVGNAKCGQQLVIADLPMWITKINPCPWIVILFNHSPYSSLDRLGSLRFPTFVRCHRIKLWLLRKVPLAVDLDEITPGEKPPKMTHYIGPVVADCFCILKDAANGRRCLHTQNLFKQIECP
jgi:hypothetical protein